jgi:hypothetical protein
MGPHMAKLVAEFLKNPQGDLDDWTQNGGQPALDALVAAYQPSLPPEVRKQFFKAFEDLTAQDETKSLKFPKGFLSSIVKANLDSNEGASALRILFDRRDSEGMRELAPVLANNLTGDRYPLAFRAGALLLAGEPYTEMGITKIRQLLAEKGESDSGILRSFFGQMKELALPFVKDLIELPRESKASLYRDDYLAEIGSAAGPAVLELIKSEDSSKRSLAFSIITMNPEVAQAWLPELERIVNETTGYDLDKARLAFAHASLNVKR